MCHPRGVLCVLLRRRMGMQDVSKLCVDGVEMCCGCDLPGDGLDLLYVKLNGL